MRISVIPRNEVIKEFVVGWTSNRELLGDSDQTRRPRADYIRRIRGNHSSSSAGWTNTFLTNLCGDSGTGLKAIDHSVGRLVAEW